MVLKQLITEWQTISVNGERVPNSHDDKEYDARMLDRLGDLHERAEVVLDQLASALARIRIYREKLSLALTRAEDGQIAWVSDAKTESYDFKVTPETGKDGAASSEHVVVVRVYDRYENMGAAKTLIRGK